MKCFYDGLSTEVEKKGERSVIHTCGLEGISITDGLGFCLVILGLESLSPSLPRTISKTAGFSRAEFQKHQNEAVYSMPKVKSF